MATTTESGPDIGTQSIMDNRAVKEADELIKSHRDSRRRRRDRIEALKASKKKVK